MEGCLTDFRKTIMDKLFDKAIEKSRYFFCFTCIVKKFDDEKVNLKAASETMKQRFDVATQRDKDVQSNAQDWKKQVDKLLQEETPKKQSCFFGFCPDCIWRYKKGEELANKIVKIKNLMGEKFENIELDRCLPGTERYSSQNYISFESRVLKCKELLDALKDDNNYIVGLHGMGGAGKTTLAKEVGKQLKTSHDFKYVIDTTVSFNPDIKKIQDDIAGSLGLDKWGEVNESDRPKRLWSRLTNGDKILVILDDVWKNLNFDDIGIPNSDNHKGCKVLVTTRDLRVCKKMVCGKTIQLDLLSEEEAWVMFKMHANLSNNSSKSILGKARKIATECKRLPIAIATIASSLNGKEHQEEWDVALNCLQKPMNNMGNVDDDLVDIFKCLRFSYDYLKDEKAKGLFLLCSAFPEDEAISVERLTRLGIGVNLFGEGYDKYNDARSQAMVAKNKLLDSCLLLKTEEGDVKMHDLVREAAQWIANGEILVVDSSIENQKSLIERNKNIKYLLFQGNLMDLFSSRFDGSKLEILIVRIQMSDSEDVPTSFFENMVGLRVLNLSNLSDPYLRRPSLSLPKSIQLLMNIRSLLIEEVILGDISVLGTLQSLETLEFHGCEIGEFSREIEELKKLRLLSLKRCKIRSNNPFEVIQICPSLEELYFWDSFNDFCREITLPTTLQRYHLIDHNYIWNEPTSKHVCLEKNDNYFSEATYKYLMQTSDHLRLTINKGWKNLMPEIVPIDQGMNDLIELQLRGGSQLQCLVDTEHINSQVPPIVFSKLVKLVLIDMQNLEELCKGPISFDSMNNLRYVKLYSCSRLVSIFELSTSQNLPLLEKLKIIDCENLENIITFANGYNDNKSCYSLFPKLKVLKIQKCHQLQFILPILSAQHQEVQFTSLKRVRIEDLPNFVDIFPRNASSSSKDGSKPQIQPDPVKGNIFSMCCKKIPLVSEDQPQDCSISLESNSYCLNIWERAQCLSRQTHILCNNIKEIELSNFSKIKCVFILSIAPRGLESLTIKSCDELKQIIIDTGDHNSTGGNSLSIVFQKLKKLCIEDCLQLEYIIGHYNDDHQNHTQIQPHTEIKELSGNEESGQQLNLSLEDIELCNLPMMTCLFIGVKNSFVLKNLTRMKIFQCEKLETVFPTSVSRYLPQLVSLIIVECKELKHIIEDDFEDKKFQSSNTCFPKLQNLVVENCHKLKCIFKVSICKEFPELKAMMIREANELEEIFKSELGDKKEISKSELVEIPKLKVVAFVNLPSLRRAQGVHFQAVKHRFVDGCQKLSLTSASSHTVFMDLYDLCGVDIIIDMRSLFEQLQQECKGHNTGNENSSAEITKDFAAGVEVQATSEHHLTSPQKTKQTPKEEHGFDENVTDLEIPSVALSPTNSEELMNQQHPLGETDATIKPSQEYNLEGSTSEITAATTLSTITETKNKPTTQVVIPKQKVIQINVEEGTTSDNAKAITLSTHLDAAGSSSGQLVTSECKTSSQEDGDSQITLTSSSISTTETNDQDSLNEEECFKKVSSNIKEQFHKDDKITVSKSEPSSVPCKEDPSQKVEDLSSSLLVKCELEQLVSKNHLDSGNLSLLIDFFVKHPSVRLKDTSLSNRYKGCAYNSLAGLLKFLQTHSVLEVLGSCHSEFMELLQDAHSFGFDKDWLDGVERRTLVSQDVVEKLLDSKEHVTKEVEVLKHKLTSSQAELEKIIQQEMVLSGPIGY